MEHKCPYCSAPLEPQDKSYLRCPECGYSFTSTDSSDTISPLSEEEPDFYIARQEASNLPPIASPDHELPAVLSPLRKLGLFLGVDKGGWISLAIGIVIALIALAVPFFTQLLVVLPILIHELGHAIFGWFFGYPSLPALDFRYGGGVCIHSERDILILIVVYVIWAAIFYFWGMENRKRMALLASLIIAYTVFAFTSIHDVIILFMGHGMELVFSGIFIYRALSGSSIVHSVERPLYAYIGAFIVLGDLLFSYRLFTDETTRDWYENAKGGGHIMDFSRIAEDYLNTDLTTVAAFFLVCCILTPFFAFAFLKWKESIFRFFTA